ncbi:MAG: hypothetical protein EXR21_02710 [Flavobacteriaceae bacterium]|nr:hypothetical protein [Flavobacteriaceae bacterium]
MNFLPKKDHDLVGFILGAAAPVVMISLFMLMRERHIFSLSEDSRDTEMVMSIAVNLLFFYYYLNRGMMLSVRGIVLSCILWALIYIFKFII